MHAASAKPCKIRAVVFDLFKTLCCCTKGSRAHHQMMKALGLTEEEIKLKRVAAQKDNFSSLSQLAELLRPGHALDIDPFERLLEDDVATAEAYPETISVLRRLKAEGYKIGVISNITSQYKEVYHRLGLSQLVDQVIFSCDVGHVKPEPWMYEAMISRLRLQPAEIIMTGDQFLKDVYPPRQAGMMAILLDRSGQAPISIRSLDEIFRYL